MQLFDVTPTVCLYSGGLDSAAGLARRLGDGIERPLIPVVIRHRSDIARKTDEQLRVLKQVFGAELASVCTPMVMVSPKRLSRSEETSQRARSFLFIAVGGVVAWASQSSAVELYESGIGAMNVPLLSGMDGSQSTRSAHPRFLQLMSQLLSEAAGRQIDVTLPFRHMTKGEVAKSLNVGSLPEMARVTASCAHYPMRNEKGGTWKSCGLCPACIFRRVALHSAGLDEPEGAYEHDLLNPHSDPVEWKKRKYLAAFLNQIDSWTDLDKNILPIAVLQHLVGTEIVGVGEPVQVYVDLYKRYRLEWLEFIASARKNGCSWANLVDLPGQAA
jgi:7-cyano-7-deazaguanine synthase in queuosine biosynthesis